MGTPLLKLDNVTVSFNGFKALNNLSFGVAEGGTKILIGPNGSGKTTLLDTITGKVRPEAGRVVYKGTDITKFPEHRIVQMGICRKFQTPGVMGNLTVQDNLALAVRREKHLFHNLRPGLSAREEGRVADVLELIRLAEKKDRPAAELSHGEKQWLEIGMVVAGDPELILLDEPTAGMTGQEVNMTASLIKKLTEKQTVLVIDHDMSFVEKLGGTVSVLHMGSLLREGDIRSIRQDPEVISVYLGRQGKVNHARA